MNVFNFIKINDKDPSKALLQVDYMTLLPYLESYIVDVYEGNVLFIDFPYMEEQFIRLSREYYMEGVADITRLAMNPIYEMTIDRAEHRFVKQRPIEIDTGQTIIISGEARAGKSSLALWLAYSLYKDWKVAISFILIDPLQLDDLVEAMRAYGFRKIPLIIIDDAGIAFGKQVGKMDRMRLDKISKYAQTWSIKFNNVVMTIPSESRLSSVLWKSLPSSISLTVSPAEMRTAEVHAYKNVMTLNGNVRKVKYPLRNFDNTPGIGIMMKRKLEEFSHIVFTPRLIPTEAYEQYRKLREEYLYVISKL